MTSAPAPAPVSGFAPSAALAGPRPNEEVLLDLWLDHSSADERDPIGINGEPSYRYFWSTWVHYLMTGRNGLQATAIAWHEVVPEDIYGFLQTGTRSRKEVEGVSDITRRRYWRLLDRIYAFALAQGWVDSNPALALAQHDRPPPEDPLGAIMTAPVWKAALDLLHAAEPHSATDTRNRALLHALFELGITPMEARALLLSSVLRSASSGAIEALQLDGSGKNQRRRIQVSPPLASALSQWLQERTHMTHAARSQALFCSNRGGAMSPDNLLVLVRELILQASRACDQPPPPRLGPQVVRNTRLVMWLNEGIPAGQVAVWAGLKNVKGLYRLREHLNPEIRLSVGTA